MKSINKKMLTILMVSLTSLMLYSYKAVSNIDSDIQGTWVSESDANWKMVFEESNCKWFYNGQLQDDYTYQVNNSSPQCEIDVLIDSSTKYLSLINSADSTDKTCYEIYGLSENTLTLRVIDRGGFLIFHR